MSLPSIKDVVGGWIKPLLPDQWQDKVSMHLFYCSAYQNFKRGLYQDAVDDLNIVVSQAKKFGNNHLLAEAYLLRGFSYSHLTDMERVAQDIMDLDEIGHPYETILRSWFIYLLHDPQKEDVFNVLPKRLGNLSVDKLVEVSASGHGIQLLDPADEIALMYSDIILEAMSAGKMEPAAKVLKKLSEYLQKMAENGYDTSRFLFATSDLREKIIQTVKSLVHAAEFNEADAASAEEQYRRAYYIAFSGHVIFPGDPELCWLKGRTARRLSAQVNGEESQQLLKETVNELKALIEQGGGISAAVKNKDKKESVKEYAIAKSEYAKYFIDNKRTLKKEFIKELLKGSEEIWLLLEKEYPEDLDLIPNRLWVTYRRGKLEKSHAYALENGVAPAAYKKIINSSSASPKLKSEMARLYMWFVLEEANMKLEELGDAKGAAVAKELFLLHNINDIINAAEKYTKGERWLRDLLWGKQGYEQIMGDIMTAGGNTDEALKQYRWSLLHLDTLDKKEHRKWMVSYYRGLVKMKMKYYMAAISFQKDALSKLPTSEEERIWKAKKALWQALEKRVELEDPPLEEKYDDIVRMAELAIDNLEACRDRDVDPLKYLDDAVIPAFELISKHGLCRNVGKKFHARLGFLLSRADVINVNLKSKELKEHLDECRQLLLQ